MLQFRNGGNTAIAGTSSSNSVRSSKAIRPADDVPGRQVGVTLADVTLMPSGDRVRSSCDMTDIVKVFGCRPHDDGAAHSGGPASANLHTSGHSPTDRPLADNLAISTCS